MAIGFSAAAVLGIPLGVALGWYPAAHQVLNPILQILRPISPIAWIPVAIIFFGVGDRAAVFLIFLDAFFPIVVTCVNGVSGVPTFFRLAGRNFGLTPPQLLARIVFPARLTLDSGFRKLEPLNRFVGDSAMWTKNKLLLLLLGWLVLISSLHAYMNVNWAAVLNDYRPPEKRKIIVAYIPVTCQLTCS